jgi:hypothetical protein
VRSATTYEIYLECQDAEPPGGFCGPLTVSPQLQTGVVSGSLETQTVKATVAGLQPGYSQLPLPSRAR